MVAPPPHPATRVPTWGEEPTPASALPAVSPPCSTRGQKVTNQGYPQGDQAHGQAQRGLDWDLQQKQRHVTTRKGSTAKGLAWGMERIPLGHCRRVMGAQEAAGSPPTQARSLRTSRWGLDHWKTATLRLLASQTPRTGVKREVLLQDGSCQVRGPSLPLSYQT